MTEFSIRLYQAGDRPALRQIAADTAFFGQPIEALMEDRRLFLDSFYRYYTDVEPEHAWVACAGGQVAGFLTGRLTWRYLSGIAADGLRGRPIAPNLDEYPAHLHINVAAPWRGHGLGRRLMEAYLEQLRGLGLVGVHLETTDHNAAACRMYERFGFRLLGARPSRLWSFAGEEQVEMRCYGLRLAGG